MNAEGLRYAGFWPRLASLLLDFLILVPLVMLMSWGMSHYRLFQVYCFLPNLLFALFFSVYLVRRFGGTPGKLLVGIRIRKLDGSPVGYREAILRYLPDFILCMLSSIALILPLFQMTDTEYHSLSNTQRYARLIALAPFWYKIIDRTQMVWIWGELLVLLTNRKRRALHDFIAGTVVVHVATQKSPDTTVASPAVTT